jgi:hypothetical protein
MSEVRIEDKDTLTAAQMAVNDLLVIVTAAGLVKNAEISEVIKKILGGDITAGTALKSAAVILDADKKVEGVGGIRMASNYVPSDDLDVVSKTYLDKTRFNEDSPVLIHRAELVYSDFISGTPLAIKAFDAGVMILGIYVRVKTGFTDTGTDLLKIGKTGTEDYFEADFDVSSTGMKDINDASFPYVLTAGESVTATYTGANGNADAGAVEIYVKYVEF